MGFDRILNNIAMFNQGEAQAESEANQQKFNDDLALAQWALQQNIGNENILTSQQNREVVAQNMDRAKKEDARKEKEWSLEDLMTAYKTITTNPEVLRYQAYIDGGGQPDPLFEASIMAPATAIMNKIVALSGGADMAPISMPKRMANNYKPTAEDVNTAGIGAKALKGKKVARPLPEGQAGPPAETAMTDEEKVAQLIKAGSPEAAARAAVMGTATTPDQVAATFTELVGKYGATAGFVNESEDKKIGFITGLLAGMFPDMDEDELHQFVTKQKDAFADINDLTAEQNFSRKERVGSQNFQHTEGGIQRGWQSTENAKDRANSRAVASIGASSRGGGGGMTAAQQRTAQRQYAGDLAKASKSIEDNLALFRPNVGNAGGFVGSTAERTQAMASAPRLIPMDFENKYGVPLVKGKTSRGDLATTIFEAKTKIDSASNPQMMWDRIRIEAGKQLTSSGMTSQEFAQQVGMSPDKYLRTLYGYVVGGDNKNVVYRAGGSSDPNTFYSRKMDAAARKTAPKKAAPTKKKG